MQSLYRTLRKCYTNGEHISVKRFYAKKCKNDKRCPPCHKPAPPKLPLTARQFKEKECSPCAYQMQLKKLPDDRPACPEIGNCKIKPCPKNTLQTVNRCPKKKPLECPQGDWENH